MSMQEVSGYEPMDDFLERISRCLCPTEAALFDLDKKDAVIFDNLSYSDKGHLNKFVGEYFEVQFNNREMGEVEEEANIVAECYPNWYSLRYDSATQEEQDVLGIMSMSFIRRIALMQHTLPHPLEIQKGLSI